MEHAADEDFLVHDRLQRLYEVVGLGCVANEPLGIAHLGEEVVCVFLGVVDKGMSESTD